MNAEMEHDALREVRNAFEKAVNENQLEQVRPYLAKDFSVVTFTDKQFVNFDGFKRRWQETRLKMLRGGTYSVDLNPELSTLLGNLALCKGNARNTLVTGEGNRYEFESHWTAVLIKEESGWQILRAHCSLDPFNNPMLVAGVKNKCRKLGITAGLVGLAIGGLAIGSLAGWLCRRGSK